MIRRAGLLTAAFALLLVLLLIFLLVGVDAARVLVGWQPAGTDVAPATPVSIAPPTSASAPPRTTIPDTDVPGTDLAGLPRYPGATRVGYGQSTTGDLVETRLEYLTADGLARVHTFYRSMFTATGWFVADLDFAEHERYFFVINGTREARVRITSDDSSVTISITHSQLLDHIRATGTPAPTIPTPPQPESTSTPVATSTPEPTATPMPTRVATSTPEPPPPPPEPPPPSDDDDDDDDDWDDDADEDDDDADD